MMGKLECLAESASTATLLENIEGKIIDLQSQLRSVREQRESGVIPQATPSMYGGRGGRGYAPARGRGGRGVPSYYPQYSGRGRGSYDEGRGRGRGYSDDSGRGRGRYGGRGPAASTGGYFLTIVIVVRIM